MSAFQKELILTIQQVKPISIKERTLVGLHKARENGKVGGRPKIDGRTVRKIRALYYENKETIQFISNKCGVSVGTCYKYINLPETDVERLYS